MFALRPFIHTLQVTVNASQCFDIVFRLLTAYPFISYDAFLKGYSASRQINECFLALCVCPHTDEVRST